MARVKLLREIIEIPRATEVYTYPLVPVESLLEREALLPGR